MKEESNCMRQPLPDIKTMYESVSGTRKEWGLEFYRVTPKYIDLQKEKENRQGPVKNNIKVKVGDKKHFLDQIAKQSCSPGPNKYNTSPEWTADAKNKNPRVLDTKSFVQQIVFRENKHKFPAPNAYNIRETDQQINKRLGKMKERKAPDPTEKLNYLSTVQYESLKSPGPGNYNPHQIQTAVRKNHFTPQQIIQSHREKQKKTKQRLSQSQVVNYNPVVHYTFQQRLQLPRHFEENKTNAFKKESSKKPNPKATPSTPAPNHYSLVQDWSSKSGVFKSVSNLKTLGVYH